MSSIDGQYTLHSSVLSPSDGEEHGREEKFNDLADALSAAWAMAQKGGAPTHVIYENAVLLSGDDLKQALSDISSRGAQPDAYPIEIVRQMLPELLIRQLTKTVHYSHEHFGAMVVYRDLLEDLYKAADQAIQKNNLGLLYEITGKLAFWHAPGESEVKLWGKDFLHAYRRDAGWLRDAIKALEKIQAAAEKLEADEGSRNAELKAEILEAAERGLITHI